MSAKNRDEHGRFRNITVGFRVSPEENEQINAAVADLTRTAEIVLPGEVSISRDDSTGEITDSSTLEDDYVITAIATWCNMHIGNPPNYDNLLKAYKAMKGSMRISKEYTTYGEATV